MACSGLPADKAGDGGLLVLPPPAAQAWGKLGTEVASAAWGTSSWCREKSRGERSRGKAQDGEKGEKGKKMKRHHSAAFPLKTSYSPKWRLLRSFGWQSLFMSLPSAKALWIIFQTHVIFLCCSVTDLNKPFSAVCQKQRKKANECLEDESPSGSHLMAPHCYRLVTTSHTVE